MALEKGTRSLCEISHLCNRAPSWTLALGSTLTRCVGQRVFTLRVAVSNSGAGRGIIPFALQALQLHATPANPSAHTTSVRAKLYKPAVGVRVRARSAPAHPLGDETHVTSHYMRTMSHLTRGGIGHFDPDRFSTSFRGCGPLGSERPVLRTGSITLLRYVSLPNGPHLRALTASQWSSSSEPYRYSVFPI